MNMKIGGDARGMAHASSHALKVLVRQALWFWKMICGEKVNEILMTRVNAVADLGAILSARGAPIDRGKTATFCHVFSPALGG